MLGKFTKTNPPSVEPSEASPGQPDKDPAQLPKGRATPKRKDSEGQRKQSLKLPSDPKDAKKAMRQRDREARMEARAGLMAGDERYLPARDQGKAKAFTRDFVDRRRRASEYFVFIAIGILVAGFLQNSQIQGFASLVWFVVVVLIVGEMAWTLVTLNNQLKSQWPDKADRKGCLPYCALRALQIRRLRIPPPRVRPGGAPVDPKP